MVETVKRVQYFYAEVSDKPGEGARLLPLFKNEGSSLACVHPTRMSVVSQHGAGEDVKKPAPQDTQTRSRLLIGQNGPSDSALAASSGWRLLAAQPLTGTLRAALLGACARACVPRRYTPSQV